MERLKVPTDRLRWRCDPAVFGIESSADLDPDGPVIGQERALKALKLGVEVRSPGYNVFVSGLSGTGRMTAVRRLMVGLADTCVNVTDKAYVHNFTDSAHPRLLQFPRGQLREFQARMEEFVRELRRDLAELFEDEQYLSQRREIEQAASTAQQERFESLAEECRLAGLQLVQIKQGPMTRPGLGVPVGDKVVPLEALKSLVQQGEMEEERAELLQKNADGLMRKLDVAVVEARRTLRALNHDLEEFDRRQAHSTFSPGLESLRDDFAGDELHQFLDTVQKAILDRVELFRSAEDDEDEPPLRTFMRRLRVNPILDNADRQDTPVIIEQHPTYTNLFGTVEHRMSKGGDLITDHTRIRAGSLVEADGGYLILSAEDVLSEPGVWPALKRVLKTNQLEIQPRANLFGMSPLLFKPAPIPLHVKVILIGDPHMYGLMYAHDPEFRKSFKIRADFDSVMPRSDDNIKRYATFLARLAHEESLLPFDRTAMAALAEEGARRTDHGGKISTRFAEIADVARESHHFAQADGAAQVLGEHVRTALHEARERDDLYDEKQQEAILEGSILISTEGSEVGQVNGLAVVRSGQFSFGKPSRITATVAAGDHGLLNIEREVDLSGEIHDKGVLILTSFLRERFGQKLPLSMSASLCFEQNYAGVDGDSASSTELYALLSVLSGLPLRQGIAITGSVNQKGDIQPIGGVNEKIEGFYRVCAARELDGSQGVIIPIQNVDDLMLSEDIVAAVDAGKFAIYAVRHVDEGIEILTGQPAGVPNEDGEYPEDTVNSRVSQRLWSLAELARDFKGGSGSGDGDGDSDGETKTGDGKSDDADGSEDSTEDDS